MVDIAGFRGWRYNTARFANVNTLVAPPYDVISPAAAKALGEQSPYNIVHVDLPKTPGAPDSVYADAGARWRAWCADGVLVQDKAPAVYPYEQQFQWDKTTYIRRGILAAVQLEDFSSRRILPHERTLSGPKEDRLKLMDATDANLSPVFTLSDIPFWDVLAPDGGAAGETVAEVTDPAGNAHRLGRVTDPAVLSAVAERLRPARLLIADGHHRYETALAYRTRVGAAGDDAHPAASVLMCIVAEDDPGLLVLPYHRALITASDARPRTPQQILDALAERFEIQTVETGWTPIPPDEPGTFGMTTREGAYILRYRGRSPYELDVKLLHAVVLHDMFGLEKADEEKGGLLLYSPDAGELATAVRAGEAEVAFFTNPVKLGAIRGIAGKGGIVPQKTTYFYPKLLTGLVVRSLAHP